MTLQFEARLAIGDPVLLSDIVMNLHDLADSAGTAPATLTCIGRLLGEAAMLDRRLEDARHFYGHALGIATEIRFRPELALTRLGLAELDAAAGHTNAAREHLAFCVPEFEAMKMRPALERALALRARLDG
jgi:hypothetical protein